MAKQSIENLHDLLVLKTKVLYDIEQQITKALPKMAKAANDEELKKAFEEHLEETEGQVKRLEQIFELLGVEPEVEESEAIKGLIADAEWCIDNIEKTEVLDASLVSAAQSIEHFEMAAYGTASEWAEEMGHDEIKELLGETLEEEEGADEKLSELATSKINDAANDMKEEEDDDDEEE